MTVKEAIERSALELNNVENPIREARMLICLATGLSLEEVIVKEDRCMSSEQAEAFNKVLARRVAGEPFAYIAGEKEFMGLTFSVNKDVLIPRPDTELLVNMAAGRETTVLDLCTGSGCVAVSLARLMPWAEVTAADVSEKALAVARENAVKNGVKIEFIEKDILKGKIKFDKKFELVTANPPYIESGVIQNLMPDVRDYEPSLALDGGDDGLKFYRKIVNDAENFLEEGGRLCFEIGCDQSKAVVEIMKKKFDNVTVTRDYTGQDRVISGTLKKFSEDLLKDHDHGGHRARFKARYISQGLDGFEPHEVLELILYYAIPRQDVNAIAHRLIKRFGSLSAIFDARIHDLMKYGELSENTAVLLNLIPNLSRVYMKDRWKEKAILENTYVAGRYAIDLFVGAQYEEFYVICLNSGKGVIRSEKICEGTINETPAYPRLVVETALKNKANSVIIAHNHPSGSLKPSWSDVEFTNKIAIALENIDIELVDHFIIGGDKFTSMSEGGYMDRRAR